MKIILLILLVTGCTKQIKRDRNVDEACVKPITGHLTLETMGAIFHLKPCDPTQKEHIWEMKKGNHRDV